MDDDIIYPPDYIIHSCRAINNDYENNCVFSYNGFLKDYKLSFMKKHNKDLNKQEIDVLGTGTIFYKGHNLINRDKLLIDIIDNSNTSGIFADKFLSSFLQKENIKKCFYNSRKIMWMINNSKISLNPIPGLYEYKVKNNLIKDEFVGTKIEKEISVKKFLYFIVDNTSLSKESIEENSKSKYLNLFVHCKVITKLDNIDTLYPEYEYLILDTLSNYLDNDSRVRIIDKTRRNKSITTTIKEFLFSL